MVNELRWYWIEFLWDMFGWEWTAGALLQKERLALPVQLELWNFGNGDDYRDITIQIRVFWLDIYVGATSYGK